MPSTYIPQPGTIPAKVIAFLADKPLEQWFPTSEVLEAIGQPADWNGLNSCMAIAIDQGAVRRDVGTQENNNRRAARWARGLDAPRLPASEAAPQPPAPATAPPAVAQPAKAPSATLGPAPTVKKPEALPPGEFSYTSAGRLLIDVSGGQIALSAEETDALLAYLDQVRGIEWEPAA